MLRTHTCGQLRLEHQGENVRLCGWVQTIRDKGRLLWIDLRDRYGITQLVLEQGTTEATIFSQAKGLGREYVVCVQGVVVPRKNANPDLPTGDIELQLTSLKVINKSALPPFLIEDTTDGGAELRMKYRYLDLRRKPLQTNLAFRHQLTQHIRTYLDKRQFVEIETPMLIKSTPEGAKDFVVPVSGKDKRLYYALPQSPQTLKQLLMVAGMDRYYQIVKSFRNEDLRADRQPEFTQIDCEMSFVEQEDILELFEGLIQELFLRIKSVALPRFPRMTCAEAMQRYGSDKPDLRWGMPFVDFTQLARGGGFKVFDDAQVVLGICVKKGARLSRKDIDGLTNFLRELDIGAKGVVYVRYDEDGGIGSSVQKWYDHDVLKGWLSEAKAERGDLLLMLSGEEGMVRSALSSLRIEVGKRYCVHLAQKFYPLWIVDFPLLSWSEEEGRYEAVHHPFTAPKQEDLSLLASSPQKAKAQAYDMVINGVEVAGGSIRIHNRDVQMQIFELLKIQEKEAEDNFGFLLKAFEYGAPPHGGIAFGFDRLCMMMDKGTSIRDYIAFPKNNAGRDTMLDAPAALSDEEIDTLGVC